MTTKKYLISDIIVLSFVSKVLSFLLTLVWFQQKWQHFWKKWGLRNCLLKMNGLRVELLDHNIFIIIKSSYQDLFNKGPNFILIPLENGHWATQTWPNYICWPFHTISKKGEILKFQTFDLKELADVKTDHAIFKTFFPTIFSKTFSQTFTKILWAGVNLLRLLGNHWSP